MPAFARDRLTWLCYLALGYFAYLLNTLGPLMPFLRAELGLSYTVGSFHFSAFALGIILAGLLGERIARRFGTGRAFWGGAVGMAVGAVGLVAARQAEVTVGSALVMGTLGSLVLVMVPTALSRRYGPLRAVAVTEANVVASTCVVVAPLAIGLCEGAGWGWRVGVGVAVVALAALAALLGRAAFPEPEPSAAGVANSPLPRAFWVYWAVLFLSVSVEFCLTFWTADFLAVVVGMPTTSAASAVSVFLLAMLVGRIAGSRLARRSPITTLLVASLVLAGVGFLVFWTPRLAPVNLAGLFLAGLGVANLYPLTLSLAVGTAPAQADLASARAALASGAAILSLPLCLGWLADHIGLALASGIIGLLIVAALAMVLLAGRVATLVHLS